MARLATIGKPEITKVTRHPKSRPFKIQTKLGKIVCYADDSYLFFEGDSWDEVCKIASTETICVMDWLQDVSMVVKSLKLEAMYFSKYDQVGLKIQVASIEIQVGTTMRVLGVIFDSKLSLGVHIT
jgi:hypothetical protein